MTAAWLRARWAAFIIGPLVALVVCAGNLIFAGVGR